MTKEAILYNNGAPRSWPHTSPDRWQLTLKSMDQYSKSQAIEFFKFEMAELKKFIEYNNKVGESITSEELIRALTTFPTTNAEMRYTAFLTHQSQQP